MEANRGVVRPVPRSGLMRVRGLAAVLVAIALAVTAGGCARAGGTGARSDLTLTEAKAETQALERSIADAFEPVGVVTVDQEPDGVLLSCGEERYQWTGGVELTLGQDLSAQEAASTIASAFDDREGFSAEVEDLQSGGPTAVVSGPDGLAFVGGVDPESRVSVVSASGCFLLSGDESPFGTY